MIHTLHRLTAVWIFSGGNHLKIESRRIISSPHFKSNANTVEQSFLKEVGLTKVSIDGSMPFGWSGTYSRAPLALAAEIVKVMHNDPFVDRLIGYYHAAAMARPTPYWCLDLYKVRNLLSLKYESDEQAKKALGISSSQWSDFGNLLNNNDLRHAEIAAIPPELPPQQIDQLYLTAHTWIAKYLGGIGLAVVG